MSNPPKHAVYWAEIPVLDLEAGTKFYSAILKVDLEITSFGEGLITFLPMSQPTEVSGHIYQGKPAARGTGPTVHLLIPDGVEAASARAYDAGAKLIGEPVSIPSGVFQYIEDPDGNSIGLFEATSV